MSAEETVPDVEVTTVGSRIAAVIVSEDYRRMLPSGVTVCELTLRNGFKVTASSREVNRERARQAAGVRAREIVGHLEDYLAMERSHRESLPYEDRVRAEHDEVMQRGAALAAFIDTSEVFPTLDGAEQERMRLQLDTMQRYAAILAKRIEAFSQ
jgi:hypothetical protein